MLTCPNCGVAVAKGYPRCPKCQASLPVVRIKRATFREENLEGGTSLAPEGGGGGGSRASWIAAIALLVIGAGIAVYFATRGGAPHEPIGTDEPAAADDGDDQEEEETSAQAQVIEGAEPSGNPSGNRTAGEPRAYTARQVMKRIDDGLRVERLWAKVSSDGDVLVIESSLCDQPGVKQVVSGEVDGLREAGFASVRCQSPSGRAVFETAL